MSLQLLSPASLDPGVAAEVRSLVTLATAASGSPPLSEQVLLDLHTGDPHRHAVLSDSSGVLGYAHADSAADGLSIELVTAEALPAGLTPVQAAERLIGCLAVSEEIPLRLWAHGSGSAAEQFARAAGWPVTRELLQLRRPLSSFDVAPEPRDGLTIRPFEPGSDDAAVLAVNAAAFAHHPEQGSWTLADLTNRMQLDWFDPSGLLLAELDRRVVGFHWTKVHADVDPPLGEVYVLGVHPGAQGRRVGDQLLKAGLAHLAALALPTVLLYVEADNVPAVQLYRKLGFTVFATDVQYSAPRS